MTYYPRFSISADPMPSARPEWIGLQLTTGLWVSATFSCSGMGQGFCYGHPGGIRLIAILAQRETAELVSQGHLRWPPSVGQDWGAILGCYKEVLATASATRLLLVWLVISSRIRWKLALLANRQTRLAPANETASGLQSLSKAPSLYFVPFNPLSALTTAIQLVSISLTTLGRGLPAC